MPVSVFLRNSYTETVCVRWTDTGSIVMVAILFFMAEQDVKNGSKYINYIPLTIYFSCQGGLETKNVKLGTVL